jgi:hypothetical protein
MYFPSWKKGEYHVDIVWLPKDLLYKEIPLTLYVSNEQVTKGEWMFIAWDYKGVVVKDMLCAFEEV